jgi:hypothetical protein
LLKKYTWRPGASIPDPQLVIVDNKEEWEVEEVLAYYLYYQKLQYLIKWLGWPSYKNSWEPAEKLTNIKEAINNYYKQVRLNIV